MSKVANLDAPEWPPCKCGKASQHRIGKVTMCCVCYLAAGYKPPADARENCLTFGQKQRIIASNTEGTT